MSMLAERKQKQKWTLNPRGKYWSDDSNKFGQRMLEKMGWSTGKGLGTKEDGITQHLKQSYKNDAKGIGYADKEDQWTKHEVDFTSLLKNLSNTENIDVKKPEMSLEKKAQSSRSRVHYHKFTRGKDLSRYSEKDLANVFGRKTLKTEKLIDINDESNSNSLESNKEFGVITVNSGNMADYFKTKNKTLTKTAGDEVNNERPGFGSSNENQTSVLNSSENLEDSDKPKSKFWHMFNKTTEVKVTDETTSTEKHVEITKKVEKKRKNKTKIILNECFDNPGFSNFTEEQIINESVKKIKQKKTTNSIEENSFVNSAFEDFSSPVVKKCKKRKLQTILEESSIQNETSNGENQQTNASVESVENYSPTKKKLKKDKKKKEHVDIEVSKKGKSNKVIHDFENKGCTEVDNLETYDINLSAKKKKKVQINEDDNEFDTFNANKSSKKKKTVHEVGIYNVACTKVFKNDINCKIFENAPPKKKKGKKDQINDSNNKLDTLDDIKSSNKKKKFVSDVGICNVACTEDLKNDNVSDIIENASPKKKKGKKVQINESNNELDTFDDIKSSNKKFVEDIGIYNVACTEDLKNETESDIIKNEPPKKRKDKKKSKEIGIVNMGCTEDSFINTTQESEKTSKQTSKILKNKKRSLQRKNANKKNHLKGGVDNVACTANSFQQNIEEAITSMSNKIDDFQLDLENQMNEKKAQEENNKNIMEHFRLAKKSVIKLISGKLEYDFKGSNLPVISGYGNKK